MMKSTIAITNLPVPTVRLLFALGGVLLIGIVASVVMATDDRAWWIWAAAVGGLAALVAADALVCVSRLKQPDWIGVERRIAHTIPVGVPIEVTLKLNNLGQYRVALTIYDLYPTSCLTENLPVTVKLPAGGFVECRYQLTATERGDMRFAGTGVRFASPLGLWVFALTINEPRDEAARIRVFPDYAAVTRYALLAVDHRLSQLGVLKRRRRGDGMDFHQLRDYRDGDSPRSIDWKATDSAGLMTFGGEANTADRFLAPKKTPETVSRFLNALYPLQPSLKTPDYYQAAVDLGKRLNKRALIVVISNLRDEDEDGLHSALAQLKRRHLVLFANLKEKAIEDTLQPAKETNISGVNTLREADLIEHAAALGYAAEREAVLARMRARGVRVLDVVPEQLPMALVNRYLDLKQSGAL